MWSHFRTAIWLTVAIQSPENRKEKKSDVKNIRNDRQSMRWSNGYSIKTKYGNAKHSESQTCIFPTPAKTFACTECDVRLTWPSNREPKYLTRIIIPNQWMWRFALVATANYCSFAFDVFSCARFFPASKWFWSWLMDIYEVSFAHIEMGICQRGGGMHRVNWLMLAIYLQLRSNFTRTQFTLVFYELQNLAAPAESIDDTSKVVITSKRCSNGIHINSQVHSHLPALSRVARRWPRGKWTNKNWRHN